MGTREQENRMRKVAAKSCQSLDTWVSKVPHQEPSDTDNDSAVCDDSPLRPRLQIYLSELQFYSEDIEGKSRLFPRYTPVLNPVLCSEINSLFLDMKQKYIAS